MSFLAKERSMNLPEEYMGYSTVDLLDLWDRVLAQTTNGSENEKAGVMNRFLNEYKLCPTSWPLEDEEFYIYKKRARMLIENLRSSHKMKMKEKAQDPDQNT